MGLRSTPGFPAQVRPGDARSATYQGRRCLSRRPAPRVISMDRIHTFWTQRVRDDHGQGLAEYALILALIAIVAIVALIFLGGQISAIISEVGESI